MSGERERMPSSTPSTFGAVSAMRRLIPSSPSRTYWSRHGEPNGLSETQSSAMLESPM